MKKQSLVLAISLSLMASEKEEKKDKYDEIIDEFVRKNSGLIEK